MTRPYRLLPAILVMLYAASGAWAYDVTVTNDITYAVYDDIFLKLDLYQPKNAEGKAPVVLAIHGGSWVSGDRSKMADIGNFLASHGYAVVAPNYRLAPKYVFPAQIEDVRAAARWVQANADRHNLDPGRITALGKSAGGQLAALLAVQDKKNAPQIAAVVDLYGPMDFTVNPANPSPDLTKIVSTYLGSTLDKSPKLYTEASPITHISPDDPPLFIAHGTADKTVPISQSESMADVLKKNGIPVVFYKMEGTGHATPGFDTPEGKKLADSLLDFLNKYALKPVEKK